MRTLSGELLIRDAEVAIVVSRFNDFVTSRLREAAVDTLRRHGLSEAQVTVVEVPGSFEIPIIARGLAETGRFSAIICLGAVIQGATTHHEYINHQVAAGLMRISLDSGIPLTFGVLTCETMEQAIDRAGGKAGNKGTEAALAAIEALSLLRQIDTLRDTAGQKSPGGRDTTQR